MTEKPIIFVCGLSRCGTSLTMQMLHRAGIPCAGEWPAFEPDEIAPSRGYLDRDWLKSHAGHAIKLLDPFRFHIDADIDRLIIWLDRDHKQQARSQAKFTHLLAGVPMPNRRQLRRWEGRLFEDRPRSMLRLGLKWPKLVVRFEDLIQPGSVTTAEITTFLRGFGLGDFSAEEMQKAIRPRGPECQPGLDIELSLIDEIERKVASG